MFLVLVITKLTSCAGPRGMSALMIAAERGSVEVVEAVTGAVLPMRIGAKGTVSTETSVSKVFHFLSLYIYVLK